MSADCLFCKIRDGKIPAKIVYRDDVCLAFSDINPQAPTHALFIPLTHIASINDITPDDREKVGHLFVAAAKYAKEQGHAEAGYRVVMNCNRDAGQTVFHIHLHLLGGRPMEWPPGVVNAGRAWASAGSKRSSTVYGGLVRSSLLLLALISSTALAGRTRDRIILAVPTDDADRGVYRIVEGKLRDRGEVENASLVYRELHDPAPLTLGNLELPIPAWWPKDLRWDWESGVEACKTRADPPYGPHNKEARVCGGRLAEALWQRYLEQQKPDLVVQVLMEAVNPTNAEVDDRQRLRVNAFVPGEPSQRSAERREVEYADVMEVASVLALRVATGGGTAEPRAILRALPTPKPKVDEPIPSLPGVKTPKACAVVLPETLTIDPADARFSQILVAHWANTVRDLKERGPGIHCTLENESRPQQLMGQTVLLGSAKLVCGKAKVISKMHKTSQSVLDQVMSEEMVKKLVDGACLGKLQLP